LLARDIITEELDTLKTSDTGEEALGLMSLHNVRHLPIVNNETLLGILSESDIVSQNIDASIGSYRLSIAGAVAQSTDHIFEVMDRMAEYDLTSIPVIDTKETYLGSISLTSLLHYFAGSFSFEEPGSIVVVETDRVNYSMVEIARIIEEESAAILTSMLSFEPGSNRVVVTLKINKQDISRIIASFVRYDYTIRGTFAENDYKDALQERYDSLIHYLNV
jgi:CBS domain-containing protein